MEDFLEKIIAAALIVLIILFVGRACFAYGVKIGKIQAQEEYAN